MKSILHALSLATQAIVLLVIALICACLMALPPLSVLALLRYVTGD